MQFKEGVDAVCIIPSEDDDSPNALVVQGKYRIIMATAAATLKIFPIAKQIQLIMNKNS